MTIKLEFVSTLPDPPAFEALMRDYSQIMLDKLLAVGGPELSPTELAADTMAPMGDLAPPDRFYWRTQRTAHWRAAGFCAEFATTPLR